MNHHLGKSLGLKLRLEPTNKNIFLKNFKKSLKMKCHQNVTVNCLM